MCRRLCWLPVCGVRRLPTKRPLFFFLLLAEEHSLDTRGGVTKRHRKRNHTAPNSQPSRTFSRTSVKDFREGLLGLLHVITLYYVPSVVYVCVCVCSS